MNGVPHWQATGPNHTGFARDDGQLISTFQVGAKGEPGAGEIRTVASDHIVTSIWTGQSLHGGSSDRIEVNHHNMLILGNALKTRVVQRLELAQDYINYSVDIVENEAVNYHQRLNRLREIFENEFEHAAEQTLLSRHHHFFHMLHDLLTIIEHKSRPLNTLLNSPPMEIVEFVSKKSINVESLFNQIRHTFDELQFEIDQAKRDFFNKVIMEKVQEVLQGGQQVFHDFVVGELKAHLHIIQRNKQKLIAQAEDYQQQVNDVSNYFALRDESLSHAIKNYSWVPALSPVQQTNEYTLEDSPYLLMKMKIKQLAVDAGIELLKTTTYPVIVVIVENLDMLLSRIVSLCNTAIFTIESSSKVALYGTPPGLVMSLFTDFNDNVKQRVNEVVAPMEELISNIEGLRQGLRRLRDHYPTLIDQLRPYIDSALFNDTQYNNLRLYHAAAQAILIETQMLFKDIVFQLSENNSVAILELLEASKKTLQHMNIIEEQVERGVVWN